MSNQCKIYLENYRAILANGLPWSYQIVLERGYQWKNSEYRKQGRKGECFKNAYQMARENGWHYCEGWAISNNLIPLEHAWCVTPEGVVIDPTWENGHDYFGVIFDPEFVEDTLSKTGVYGILGNLYKLHDVMKTIKPEEIFSYALNGTITKIQIEQA